MVSPKSANQSKVAPQAASATEALGALRTLVDKLSLNEEVLAAVLPGGIPHASESQLWDYKEHLPTLKERPTEPERKLYKAEIGEIIKDALAFYNAYGGYIVFGVVDKGDDRIRGCSQSFDCGQFNTWLESYTGVNIECHYLNLALRDNASVGILLIPRRPSSSPPVKFVKRGPERGDGSRCFKEETYVRVRDECRAATATSSDWQFLHSDRSPPDSVQSTNRSPVKAILPARDPDLVKFVGREGPLSELRAWLTDQRSPLRLVTGIGGLGKSTLAYHFAEEVIETAAGEVEWIIWLTAKQRTFSALRGKLVSSGRVDFSGLSSLYDAILKALSHELPVDEDDPSLDQLADRVVDALQNYTCLIIVDDVDSLQPDEQKETVAALNGLALRTVGRDLPPSRILITSRIDQGMPPTSVVKIVGLDRDDFIELAKNLSVTFGIGKINDGDLKKLFDATSGSPLFGASILRLVRLGENLSNAIQTWRGQEGEEVRQFAFERELKRLDVMQGRLLYAVLLLGETSVSDLANVLDVTPKVVRDRVSELQAYHLISTSVKDTGDAIIVAPSDLVAVTEILRKHLGANASAIETACARAHESSGVDNRSIGIGIRRVVAAWNSGRPEEGLIIASELKERFSKSGDVANILGQAYLKLPRPRYQEADREFEVARQLGCSRPELIADTIRVKTELQDWQGLFQLSRSVISRDRTEDLPLAAFIRSGEELIATAKIRGDQARIEQVSLEVVQRISNKFSRMRLDKVVFAQLVDKRNWFAREFMRALDLLHPRAGDKLHVFEGVWRLAETDVFLSDLIGVGLSALELWWTDVERRPVVDLQACSILNRQLGRVERIESALRPFGANRASILERTAHVRLDLAHRGAKLSG